MTKAQAEVYRHITFCHPIGTRDGRVGQEESTLVHDAMMVNTLVEVAEVTGGQAAVKRPGLQIVQSYTPTTGQGLFYRGDTAYYIANDSLTPVPGGTPLVLPGVGFPGLPYQCLSNYNSNNDCLVKSAQGLWRIDGPSGAVTNVVDADYPSVTRRGLVELDGTFYVMAEDGTLRGSALQDPTSWDPLNFIGPQSSIGAGIAVHRHLNYLVALYSDGTQVFYDAANATGSPLSPVLNAAWRIGCASARSLVTIDDCTIWLSSAGSGGRSVTMLSGLSPVTISNAYIDRILSNYDSSQIRGIGLHTGGHSLYLLILPQAGLCLCYDLVAQHWGVWRCDRSTYAGGFPGASFLSGSLTSSISNVRPPDLIQGDTDGKIYRLDSGAYDDAGTAIAVKLRTTGYDWGTTKRKFIPSLYLMADTQASGTVCSIRWSDDDGASYSAYRDVPLDSQRKLLHRCGSTRQRVWELLHTANTPFRVWAAEIDMELGEG
jgi:hypothetical protein